MTKAMELRMLKTHDLLQERRRKAEEEIEYMHALREREKIARKRIAPVIEAMEYERTHKRGHITLNL